MTAFGEGPDFTVGVEEEFQLVDPDTGELVSRVDEVLEKSDPRTDTEVQSEFFQSVVETATPVCEDADDLRDEMARLRGMLAELGADHGVRIAASGTHPFAKWEEQEITPEDRYQELIREVRLPVKRELVFGQHVHVAMGSADEAIRAMNGIRAFLPLVLSLSTNAPYWRGVDSGLQSARVRVFDAMPRSGVPRTFAGWDDLEGAVELLKRAGSISDMTKIWWDVRPRPTLGTVEVRIADLPTSLEDSHALAAFTQALIASIAMAHRQGEHVPMGVHPEALSENRWRALRDGLNAEFIQLTPEGDVDTVTVPERFEAAVSFAKPAISELGLEEEIATLRGIVEQGRTGADRQREVHEEAGSLREVVLDVAQRTPPA